MQTAFLLLAFIALASAAKTVQITGVFQNAPANQWSNQHIHIFNNDSVGVNYAMKNVYFEVLVQGSREADARLGVFYGHNNAVGAIGAIMGRAYGVGSFFVFGDAGTYNLDVVVYYGNGIIVSQVLSFVVGGTQSANRELEGVPTDAVLVEKNEDFSLWRARDGSNTDINSGSGTDTMTAQAGTASWNTYYLNAGATMTNISPSYSMNTTGYLPSQTTFINPGLNGTASSWIGAHSYHLDFAAGFNTGSAVTWYVNINISYKKAGVAQLWTNAYPVAITVSKKRDAEERASIKTFAQAAIDNASTTSKLGYAFGAAGAAVGVIAAVAIVAALFTIRKNRQAATTTA